jgi:hypothetical protein
MLLNRRTGSRLQRRLILGAVLSANFIAVVVPLLHAFTHHEAYGHHSDLPLGVSAWHGEHSGHPQLLHEDWVGCDRSCGDVAFVVPSVPQAAEPHKRIAALTRPATFALQSRAPPSLELARAPPLA